MTAQTLMVNPVRWIFLLLVLFSAHGEEAGERRMDLLAEDSETDGSNIKRYVQTQYHPPSSYQVFQNNYRSSGAKEETQEERKRTSWEGSRRNPYNTKPRPFSPSRTQTSPYGSQRQTNNRATTNYNRNRYRTRNRGAGIHNSQGPVLGKRPDVPYGEDIAEGAPLETASSNRNYRNRYRSQNKYSKEQTSGESEQKEEPKENSGTWRHPGGKGRPLLPIPLAGLIEGGPSLSPYREDPTRLQRILAGLEIGNSEPADDDDDDDESEEEEEDEDDDKKDDHEEEDEDEEINVQTEDNKKEVSSKVDSAEKKQELEDEYVPEESKKTETKQAAPERYRATYREPGTWSTTAPERVREKVAEKPSLSRVPFRSRYKEPQRRKEELIRRREEPKPRQEEPTSTEAPTQPPPPPPTTTTTKEPIKVPEPESTKEKSNERVFDDADEDWFSKESDSSEKMKKDEKNEEVSEESEPFTFGFDFFDRLRGQFQDTFSSSKDSSEQDVDEDLENKRNEEIEEQEHYIPSSTIAPHISPSTESEIVLPQATDAPQFDDHHYEEDNDKDTSYPVPDDSSSNSWKPEEESLSGWGEKIHLTTQRPAAQGPAVVTTMWNEYVSHISSEATTPRHVVEDVTQKPESIEQEPQTSQSVYNRLRPSLRMRGRFSSRVTTTLPPPITVAPEEIFKKLQAYEETEISQSSSTTTTTTTTPPPPPPTTTTIAPKEEKESEDKQSAYSRQGYPGFNPRRTSGYRKPFSSRHGNQDVPSTPPTELNPKDLKEFLKHSGPLSLSEVLQQKNLSLVDLLKGKQGALTALKPKSEEKDDDEEELQLASSQVSQRTAEEYSRLPNSQFNRDSSSSYKDRKFGGYTRKRNGQNEQSDIPQRDSSQSRLPPPITRPTPPPSRIPPPATRPGSRRPDELRMNSRRIPYNYTRPRPANIPRLRNRYDEPKLQETTTPSTTIQPLIDDYNNGPTSDPREDILELLEPDSPISLGDILSSRNMTLSEFLEHRERGSSQHITSIFKNIPQKGSDPLSHDLTPETRGPRLLPNLPFFNVPFEPEISTTSTTTTTTTQRPTTHQFPWKSSIFPYPFNPFDPMNAYLGHRPILTSRITTSPPISPDMATTDATSTNLLEGGEYLPEADGAAGSRDVNEVYDENYYDESSQESMPTAVKSAIIASSVIFGLAILIFLGIFVCCKWQQKMRRRIRNPFLCERSISPVIRPVSPSSLYAGVPGATPIRKHYLWRTIRKSFR